MKALWRRQRAPRREGQTIVFFALMSLTLMAGLGLVIDAGYDYAQRRTMQNTADTAALAGASAIGQKNNLTLTAVNRAVDGNGTLTCDFIGNSRLPIAYSGGPYIGTTTCRDGAPPAGASGVRVRLREQHTTFVMRAIGIQDSGTAAVATAQVQSIDTIATVDVPFVVCGIGTTLSNRIGTYNILSSVSPTVAIDSNAYYYAWDYRSGTERQTLRKLPLTRSTFLIHGDGVAKCGMNDNDDVWRGLVDPDQGPLVQLDTNRANGTLISGRSGVLSDYLNGPYASKSNTMDHQIEGLRGCKAGAVLDNCVLILPIADATPFCTGVGCRQRIDINGRIWGAFMVYKGAGDDYYGRLIQDYPIHTDGKNVWASTYNEPITVTLVKTP